MVAERLLIGAVEKIQNCCLSIYRQAYQNGWHFVPDFDYTKYSVKAFSEIVQYVQTEAGTVHEKQARNSEQFTAGNVMVVHECVVLQSEI